MNSKARAMVFACALLCTLALLGLTAFSQQPVVRPALPGPSDSFETRVGPFVRTYCAGCHGGSQPAAGFDLTTYATREDVVRDQLRWTLVPTRLKAGEMPPAQSRQQPTMALRQSVIDWIEAAGAEEARRHPNDPGIVLAHRLSNAEYDYTIRDLTGVDIRPT